MKQTVPLPDRDRQRPGGTRKRTIIECDLENVAVGVRGQGVSAGGASVLLSVVPEGSTVKRGDVLAVLDSSDYEELLRIQQMQVERASAITSKPRLSWKSPSLPFVSLRKERSGRHSKTSREGFCWRSRNWSVPQIEWPGRTG